MASAQFSFAVASATFCLASFNPIALAQPGALNPPLLDCGMQAEVEIICDTRAPEDFEITPDGKYLIVANFGRGEDVALDLFSLETGQFSEIPLTAEKQSAWGDPACTGSLGAAVSPHGLSLTRRSGGQWQLYVVNHNVRESMEMYELQQDGDAWQLIWRGCVLAEQPYNDVSALPDGSFIATRPQAIQKEGQNLFGGEPSGNVARWSERDGEQVLAASEYGYPNGILVSSDERYAYISAWTTLDFRKYDLTTQQEVAAVELGFMPDNLTWTTEGRILAAGIKGVNGNCPANSDDPCIQGFVVTEIDPETLATRVVYDNEGRALINGTSVAIEAGDHIYVGSFQGTRLLKLPR